MAREAIEFFAGIGLVRLALERGPGPTWRTVLANDLDPMKQRLYRALFAGESDVLCEEDVAKLKPKDLPTVDLWTVSFPCTDMSLAGGRKGFAGEASRAVRHVTQLAESLKRAGRAPRAILFENVMGFLSSQGGGDFRELVLRVSRLGYAIEVLRVDARHFVPQSRPRLFLVAVRDSTRPNPALLDAIAPSEARPQAIIDAMRANPDVRWRVSKLPPLPNRRRDLDAIIEALSDDDVRWWSKDRVARFDAQIHPRHREIVNAAKKEPVGRYFTAFRRVRAINGVKRCVAEIRGDGIAGCLRTPKGGSAKQILVRAGGGKLLVRHLLPEECMRLQGVDSPVPPGVRADDMLFALGDAVCVDAVRWVLDHVVGAPRRTKSGVSRVRSKRRASRSGSSSSVRKLAA